MATATTGADSAGQVCYCYHTRLLLPNQKIYISLAAQDYMARTAGSTERKLALNNVRMPDYNTGALNRKENFQCTLNSVGFDDV